MPIGPQTFLETVNTPGGNKVQMSSNNVIGNKITNWTEFSDAYIDFKKKLASIVTTVKYGEDGIVENNTELVISDPNLAIQQLDYENRAAKINENLGELDYEGKSLMEIIKMSAERKKIIEEKLGLSPKDLIMIEFIKNPETFRPLQQEKRILPEFNQR